MLVKHVYPVCVDNMQQSVDEWHYALLQGVQCMVLRVVVPEVVPQAAECVSEQLNLICLLSEHKQNNPDKHRKLILSLSTSFKSHNMLCEY